MDCGQSPRILSNLYLSVLGLRRSKYSVSLHPTKQELTHEHRPNQSLVPIQASRAARSVQHGNTGASLGSAVGSDVLAVLPMKAAKVQLVQNTKLAEHDCTWCSAVAGREVHSAACPLGERYKQAQSLGGVRWDPAAESVVIELGRPRVDL